MVPFSIIVQTQSGFVGILVASKTENEIFDVLGKKDLRISPFIKLMLTLLSQASRGRNLTKGSEQ